MAIAREEQPELSSINVKNVFDIAKKLNSENQAESSESASEEEHSEPL